MDSKRRRIVADTEDDEGPSGETQTGGALIPREEASPVIYDSASESDKGTLIPPYLSDVLHRLN
jgi:hypothetical protein